MSDSEKNVEYGVSADPSGFIGSMNKAADGAKDAASTINDNFKKVQEVFEGVQKQFIALAAVIAGGKFFKEAISESNKLTGETMKLSKMLGVTGEEASTLRTALEDIGSSGDEYVDVFTKFARQLKNNEAGLNAMGIKTRESNGQLRDSTELFTEAVRSVSTYKAGLDQNTYAQTLFGKSIDDVMKFQKLNNGILEEAKTKNEELGLTLTQEGVNSTKAYKMAMNDVGDVLLGIKNVIGNAIKPVFTELAHWFAEVGPTAVFAFKVAIDLVVTAVEAALLVLKTLGRIIGALVDPLFTIGRAIKALISGDMNAATREMQNILPNWGKAFDGLWDNIKKDSQATWSDITNLWGKGTEVGKPKGGTKTMGDFGKSNGKETSRMSEWEAKLADDKAGLERQGLLEGQFREMSKADELQYWQQLKARKDLSDQERIAVSRKTAEVEMGLIKDRFEVQIAALQTEAAAFKNNTDERLRLERQIQSKYQEGTKQYEESAKRIVEIQKQAAEQLKQIDLMRAQGTRDAQLAELQGQQQIAQFERQMGVITQQELLAKQESFEQSKTAIALDALKERERIALADPDRNIVELERIHQEQEQLERQHQQAMAGLRMASFKESQQYMMGAVNAMGSGFQSVFQQTLQGTLTLQKAMQGLWQALTQAVSGAIAKIAADWLVLQVKNMIFGKGVAESSVAQKSAEAGAGGVASMAAAPFPLNLGAPEFGAAMAAAAMAFAPTASAAGGFDIPGTLNPITQLHASEMVLPAKHANVIRSLADQDDGGGNSGGRGDVHLHVHAVDAQSVARLFRENGQHLVSALQQQRRNFAF